MILAVALVTFGSGNAAAVPHGAWLTKRGGQTPRSHSAIAVAERGASSAGFVRGRGPTPGHIPCQLFFKESRKILPSGENRGAGSHLPAAIIVELVHLLAIVEIK
jgi:hypothetical protein